MSQRQASHCGLQPGYWTVAVAKIFSLTLQHLGEDPFNPPLHEFVDEVLAYSPSCPATAALEAIPYVSRTAFTAHVKHSKPSKSGGGDRTNNPHLHLSPKPIKTFFQWFFNTLFRSLMPQHWLASHIRLLHKHADPYQATN